MNIIPDEDEVTIDAIPLAVKSPSIVGWKIYKEGRKSYYQIMRADGKSQMYMIFSQMLKSFNKEDLEDLYKLVKAKYESTRPVEDLDLLLWGDLKTMFESDIEDKVWKNQQEYKVLNWKLYDSLTPLDIQYSAATQIWRCYRLVSRAKVIENQQSCLLHHPLSPTLPSTPIPSQAESSKEPIRRYLMETPPVPQDEDEREPMFIQPHDLDYVPEPIYPEYIPLEDEREFPIEEQPLPPVDLPTAELPGYVAESDPEEDEDDETEDGPVDYPMDGGEDRDDDDGSLHGDGADDEDQDEEDEDEEDEEEEEEHLALTDSAVVVPTIELVSPPEGTEHVIPPPSTDITTTGSRIIVRLQASISLPPEAEVERLLAMPTPPPPPPISLSPPSTGERLARIAFTQALVDAVTAALPSPPLPPLQPSLYIPPPIDHRDDIPESERPPRKRLCLFALGLRYEVGESSTARPTEDRGVRYGIRDTWVDLAEAVPEIEPMIVGEVNTRVTELAELHEHDTRDLYALSEDAQDSRTRIS
ncbi:hypothetical protein Tco_0991963 [Tanacetum coccineum]|uniref:Uncharacterized protein n=1 Tax=Tanacetum coccineum TaxID=301880 RepID=A0ABQ5F126_9ASTR